MNDLNPSRKPAAWTRPGCLLALLLVAGFPALVAPLRADNPPTFLFQIGPAPVAGGALAPAGVALDTGNNIYVLDQGDCRVLKFASNGVYLAQWGMEGSGIGQFFDPLGLAVGPDNSVYVSDQGNSRVQKFTSSGAYLTQWGGSGSGNGQFMENTSIAVDGGNNVYVVDVQNNRVEKFNSSGGYLAQWNSSNVTNTFFSPQYVAVDRASNVYVADYDGPIFKVSSSGNLLAQFVSYDDGGDQMIYEGAAGMAVDISNNIYIAEGFRVQKADSNGVYLTEWGTNGSGFGTFSDADSVAVDSTGNYIYVADFNNGLIQVFVNNPHIVPSIITIQPMSQAVPPGNVTLEVGVAGTAPFSYQWSSNNVAVPGATNATFTLTNAGFSDSGEVFAVLVSNNYGSALSSSAVLTVEPSTQFLAPTFVGSIYSNAVPGGFQPIFLAVDASNIYVTDYLTNRVLKLSGNGSFLTQWPIDGGLDEFNGIAVDSSNNIYVGDTYSSRLEKFDDDGDYLTHWGSFGSGNGQFFGISGMATDSSNNIYVADANNYRMEKFTSSGAYQTQWGSSGTQTGQFDYPNGVAVDSSNNVYVTDSYNNRVQKFTSNGSYLAQWGLTGAGNGQMANPTGIAVDRQNNVYVTDEGNSRIQKFDSNGNYLTQWGNPGNGNGEFNRPQGIVLDVTGNLIYVADSYNNRIEIFAYNTNILPPLIVSQPADQIILAGENITLSVGVAGTVPVFYQWLSNNIAVIGATNATFTLSQAGVSDSASYSALITNNYGSALSSSASVAVVPAVVIAEGAGPVSQTGTVLNGSVTVGPDDTTVWFEWGTNTSYGNSTATTPVPGNSGSTQISSALGSLTNNVYHFRLDASNAFGIVYGNDQAFAVGSRPMVITLLAINSANGSVLNASVTPGGLDTKVYFKWGPEFFRTNTTVPVDAGAGIASLNIGSPITGLARSSPYSYQAVASNFLGTVLGTAVTFLPPPFASAPFGSWQSVASSANGSILVAAADAGFGAPGGVFISTNSGLVWNRSTNASLDWDSMASSADGSKLIAVYGLPVGPGSIFTSTNSGTTWTRSPTNISLAWNSVASSADGVKLAAVAEGNRALLYTSTNSGLNWTLQTNGLAAEVGWLASSADGNCLIAAPPGNVVAGSLYTSTNAGVNWIKATNAPVARWLCVASSANGNQLLAGSYPGYVYLSTNSGLNWTQTSLPTNNWNSVAESADGTKAVALANSGSATLGAGSGGIWTSTDSGNTWVSNNMPSASWTSAAMSADGNEFVASMGYPSTAGGIYVSQTIPAPVLSLPASGNTLVSWIIPSLNFTLQQSFDLSNWTDMTNLPVLNLTNLENQVVLPSLVGSSFFRLKH